MAVAVVHARQRTKRGCQAVPAANSTMSDDKKAVAEEKKAMMDVMAMFMNVTTSVLIVFVNKVLLDPKHGYKFTFGEHGLL